MTVEEFNNMKFRAGMRVEHNGKTHDLASVNFEEQLVAFNIDEDDDLYWARCENVEIITPIDKEIPAIEIPTDVQERRTEEI